MALKLEKQRYSFLVCWFVLVICDRWEMLLHVTNWFVFFEKHIAEQVQKQAEERNLEASLVDLANYDPEDSLADEVC